MCCMVKINRNIYDKVSVKANIYLFIFCCVYVCVKIVFKPPINYNFIEHILLGLSEQWTHPSIIVSISQTVECGYLEGYKSI